MPRILKQNEAERDLIEIWQDTYEAWGDQQADDYLDKLNAAIQSLAQYPLRCRERTEFKPPVRICYCEQHLIIYRELEDGVDVVRVLHKRMDVESRI